MNKYTELSNFEINKKVAEKAFGEDEYEYEVECTKYGVTINDDIFDPCNTPADAMPIIIENKLTLSPRYDSDEWVSESMFYHDIYSVNKNPLRAAMEVFLMMKEAENENNNNS